MSETTVRPTDDGAADEWTAQGAGSKYVEVDESSADGDTSYNESSDTNEEQEHGVSFAITNGDIINHVRLSRTAKRSGAAASSRTLSRIRVGGSVYRFGYYAHDGNYQEVVSVLCNNPADGSAWTENAVESDITDIGYESASLAVGRSVRVTQAFAVCRHYTPTDAHERRTMLGVG